jgi:hypothetical protein
MSIKVVCPNGHALTVSDKLAGRSGRCPACKARVQIPQHRSAGVSEDAILDILGPHSPGPARHAANRSAAESAEELPHPDRTAPPKKTCYKCQQEISAATHICPFCHTYIASLADF